MSINLRTIFVFLLLVILVSCADKKSAMTKKYSIKDLLNNVNKDSLEYNSLENTYFDKYGDSSGSLYKFSKEGSLIFYCFLNEKIYPFAEYYNPDGTLKKSMGKPSVQVRYIENDDSSYRISFLFSTFRKSNYVINTITNFSDTLQNYLSTARGFSNVGYFNIVVRNRELALKTNLINYVTYFDSLQNVNRSFADTIFLKDIFEYDASIEPKK